MQSALTLPIILLSSYLLIGIQKMLHSVSSEVGMNALVPIPRKAALHREMLDYLNGKRRNPTVHGFISISAGTITAISRSSASATSTLASSPTFSVLSDEMLA